MNIVFNTYPSAFAPPGGGEIQLLQYKHHLELYGIQVSLFDLWQGDRQIMNDSVMHFFSCMPGSVPFLRFCADRGVPIVVSPNLWVTKETMSQYPFAEIQAILSIATAVVCNSDAECELLSDTFDVTRKKFFTVYNGVNEVFFKHVPQNIFRDEFGVSGRFVLNVANIEQRKNQLGLVRAVKHFPDLKLVVVGHVRDPAYADLCAKEGGDQWCHVGSLPHGSEVLRAAFSACEVFALPSTLETPGLAALEAAACGCPVVITSVGSTKEYFRNDAIYVDPDRIESIADGIQSAISSRPPSIQNKIERLFSWQVVIQKLIPVYEEVLRHKRCRENFFSDAGVFGEDFHEPEFDDEGWFVWSRQESTLKTLSGLLAWRWWAQTDIDVDLYLDGVLYVERIAVGPVWAPYALDLSQVDDEALHEIKFRIRGEVLRSGGRELGVMFRDMERAETVGFDESDLRAWYIDRGLILEAAGLKGTGFYVPEQDDDGWFIWSRSDFQLQVIGKRLEFGCFVVQDSRLVFKCKETGEIKGSFELNAGDNRFTLDLSCCNGNGQPVYLCAEIQRFSPVQHADPRDLGVMIKSVQVLN